MRGWGCLNNKKERDILGHANLKAAWDGDFGAVLEW